MDISETALGKEYLKAKSREVASGDRVGWSLNRDIDNRERLAEESESAMHDARVYVGDRGEVCWLVANLGKSRVVRRIDVENGGVRLKGLVRRVEMEVWPDGTSNEITFAEITGSRPDKVKRVNEIHWT